MDAPLQLDVVIRVLVESGLHEEFDPALWLFATKLWISSELFWFWTFPVFYDKISFCFHALLFISDCYRTSLDRDGSILVLFLLIVSILMAFQTKSFIGTVLLMTASAICFKPFEIFVMFMNLKSYWDWMIAYFICGDVNMLQYQISSRISDFIFIVVYIISHSLYYYARPNNSVEDRLLLAALVGHIVVFFFKLYTKEYLCCMLGVTLLWMHLKSLRFARIRSILTEW